MSSNISQQEINWLLAEKYNGKITPEAEKDIARLEKGEHIDYVIGWVDFLGCRIDLSRKPLIPRVETEYWTGKIIEVFQKQDSEREQAVVSRTIKFSSRFTLKGSDASQKILSCSPRLRVLDIFAGSGCIGVAVLKHIPLATVDFAEEDKKFCEKIKVNLKGNDIDVERCRVIQSNIFSNIKGRYDYILANPPYIARVKKDDVQRSVLGNDPHGALFGGENGLLYITKFLEQGKQYLKPGGVICMEFDSFQKNKIAKLIRKLGYKNFEFHKDQYSNWRYVVVSS